MNGLSGNTKLAHLDLSDNWYDDVYVYMYDTVCVYICMCVICTAV